MLKIVQIYVDGFDSNFSYLIYDAISYDAAIVDPCGDVELIAEECRKLPGMKPNFILLTHGHSDHVSGLDSVKKFFSASVAAHPNSLIKHDISLLHKQKLKLGNSFIECLHAPGHTKDSIIYHLCDDSAIFTGDTLFIDCCGYCEAESMFKTMKEVIYPLADSNIVYSGHDYGRVPFAALGEEKIKNPYLSAKTLKEFKEELKDL
ncbi:MAG TPA: hypothetical protein DD381_07505 [Lentisphaeria bacterium]|nr:MAG: hypothetical protein A2X47_04085 [Lentisphaerae bacterium GWF2_38_69]HBM16168.1 hypothetical protein [Lentisphaeria bacterium]